ncbi:MAG TPA: phosphatidate cytidylyltransferase [Actinomycetales bacterium]|nr:phosphatidate cytidylyltransferase [Actinomycetales bacterium]
MVSPGTTKVAEGEDFGRAGRNLGAAILVGLGLLLLIAVSLAFRLEVFVALVALVSLVGIWELAKGFATRNIHIPLAPLWVGAIGMHASAWVGGPDALLIALLLTVATVFVWRVLDGGGRAAARDSAAGAFAAAYVPFLAAFAVLIVRHEQHGILLVVTYILMVVGNDTGGYIAGVLFGRHPIAPAISPKKSWEGAAGSLVLSVAVAYVMLVVILDAQWWWALALGVLTVITATTGDLAESLIKRDLGLKDFGSILPGHGGILDRIDSQLVAAPACYLVFSLAVPA